MGLAGAYTGVGGVGSGPESRCARRLAARRMALSMKRRGTGSPHDRALRALREFGLAYPEAHTKSPWPGHLDLAVRDKTFAYLSVDGEPLSISCKLPASAPVALMLPFTKPTAYGLGRSGWVTADFTPGDEPPVEMLKVWIDESYRAQAPRRLVAALATPEPAAGSVPPGPPTRTPKPGRKRSHRPKRAGARRPAGEPRPTRR